MDGKYEHACVDTRAHFVRILGLQNTKVKHKIVNITYEPQHEISNNVVCATSKVSDQPAHKRSLIRAFAIRLTIL